LPPLLTPHLEDVGEIRRELERQRDVERRAGKIAHVQMLVADAVADELGTVDMERAARQQHVAAEINVGIGEVDPHQQVVAAHGRGQQQRPPAGELECQPGEKPGALVVQSLLVPRSGRDVAEVVEEPEGVVVLEDEGALRHRHFGRQDVELGCRRVHVLRRHQVASQLR
jgi:hypothetical protein